MTPDALDGLNFSALRKMFPTQGRAFERHFADTYDDFVEFLLLDIEDGLNLIERNPELRQKDSEDRLTIDLVNHLRSRSYAANHESKNGGKVDIMVEQLEKGFTWLGEAKIHQSYDYLYEGFQQLCNRYAQGTPASNQGGLIAYVFNEDCIGVMNTWRACLSELYGDKINIAECNLLER